MTYDNDINDTCQRIINISKVYNADPFEALETIFNQKHLFDKKEVDEETLQNFKEKCKQYLIINCLNNTQFECQNNEHRKRFER